MSSPDAKTVKLTPPAGAVRKAASSRGELWKLRGLMVLGTIVGTVCFGLWLATLPGWIQDRGGPFLVICAVVGLWQSVTWKPGKL